MRSAGFVLAGGESSRMGEDKALLPYRGRTLVEHVASIVAEAAGNVMLIGPPARYGGFGFPAVPDIRPGHGPLSGVETALSLEKAEWNLIVACDLPAVPATILREMLDAANHGQADFVLPVTEEGAQPLAAAWNSRLLPRVRAALDGGQRKVMNCVKGSRILRWPAPARGFRNMNTPEEWRAFLES